jgi:hypothetical protein
MSRSITDSLIAAATGSLGQISALIDALPHGLWDRPIGGWPAWQHAIHAIWGDEFFTPGQPVAPPAGLSPDVLQLKAIGMSPPPKSEVKAYLAAVTAKIEAFGKTVVDADLSKPNVNTAKIGLDWNLATTLSVLSSHPSYHLGYGDALLRSESLPGVF